MPSFDGGDKTWGGMTLSGDCNLNDVGTIWEMLINKSFDAVFLHGPDCRMYSYDEFDLISSNF